MQILLKGDHSTEETVVSLLGILRMLEEQHGIQNFSGIVLNLNLLDGDGEDVELVDNNTSEVLAIFEVGNKLPRGEKPLLIGNRYDNRWANRCNKQYKHLRLVVDNTKSNK